MGENWAAFSPSCKGKTPPNLQEKNGQHFVLLLYKICPKNYSRLSLNCGTSLASHSTVPRPLRQSHYIGVPLAPPPDIGLWSMGPGTLRFCPSPGSLRDLQGMGQVEVEVKSTLGLSSRDVRFAQQKARLDLS